MQVIRSAALVAAFGVTVPLAAQSLVVDINQQPPVPFGSFGAALSDGASVWLSASTPDQGTEVWRTDGTAAGTRLVRDLTPGQANSAPQMLGFVGADLMFSTASPIRVGRRIGPWITDGTAAGTTAVGALIEATSFRPIGRLGARMVFSSYDAGQETLWISDPGAGVNSALAVVGFADAGVALGSVLVFQARDLVTGDNELWRTDGTAAGTGLLRDLVPTGSGQPRTFVASGGTAWFLASNHAGTVDIWSTDGTTANTLLVSATGIQVSGGTALAVCNGRLLLSAFRQLFAIDPVTGAVTPLIASSGVDLRLVADATRAFVGRGSELWTTDGTPAGTALFRTFAGPIQALTDLVQGAVFLASSQTPTNQLEVVKTDGTAAGTTSVLLSAQFGLQSVFQRAGAGVVVAPGVGGASFTQQLMFTDCTAAGTAVLLAPSLAAGTRPQFGPPSSPYIGGVSVDGVLNVGLYEPATGVELWRTDGTAAGTARVTDLAPGFQSSIRSPSELVALDGSLYYTAESAFVGLWRLPSGSSTPQLLRSNANNSWQQRLIAHDHALFFRDLDTAALRFRVFRSDGTAAGTAPVPGADLDDAQSQYVVLDDGVVVFEDGDGSLSRTDGTTAGTFAVGPGALAVFEVGGRAVALAPTTLVPPRTQLVDVYSTDGTVAGTQLLGSWSVPNLDLDLTSLQALHLGGRLYLWNGSSMLITNGTALGTSQATLPVPTVVGPLHAAADAIYFVGTEPATGRELWRTLGTAASTVRITDLGPGPADGVVAILGAGQGRRLLLSASDGISGLEPWVSDGTAAGTALLADLSPQGSSNPVAVGVAGDQVLFVADDGVHGAELFAAPLGSVGNANVETIGVGCGGTAGDAELALAGLPLRNAMVTFELRGLPAGGAAVLAFGGRGNTLLGGGCEVHVGAIADARLLLASPSGAASVALVVPASPALIGGLVVAQAGVFDPAGQAAPGLRLSNAVQLVVGS